MINRPCVREEKIKAIADEADLIVNGYAFLKNNNKIEVINLNRIEKVTILDINGTVLTTTMDEIEVDIVLDYFKQNRKYIFL